MTQQGDTWDHWRRKQRIKIFEWARLDHLILVEIVVEAFQLNLQDWGETVEKNSFFCILHSRTLSAKISFQNFNVTIDKSGYASQLYESCQYDEAACISLPCLIAGV